MNDLENLLEKFKNNNEDFLLFKEILTKFNEEKFISLHRNNELIFGLDGMGKKFVPIFTSSKQINDDIKYEEKKEVFFSDILNLFALEDKFDYIIVNPKTHNFIFNKEMIKIVIKNN